MLGPQPRVHKPLAPSGDPRWTETGAVIQHAATPYYPPTADRRGYACQPYCSVLPDGEWSCVMTFNNDSWIEVSQRQPAVSRPFCGRFAPFFRRSFALSGFLAPRRGERARNGVKWARFGAETGEKQRWLSGAA